MSAKVAAGILKPGDWFTYEDLTQFECHVRSHSARGVEVSEYKDGKYRGENWERSHTQVVPLQSTVLDTTRSTLPTYLHQVVIYGTATNPDDAFSEFINEKIVEGWELVSAGTVGEQIRIRQALFVRFDNA
jgi:hypothetical protein